MRCEAAMACTQGCLGDTVNARMETSTGMVNTKVFTTRLGFYSQHLSISCRETEGRPFSFGPAPTKSEAEEALSALRRLFFSMPFSQFFGVETNSKVPNLDSSEMGEIVSSGDQDARQLQYWPKLLESRGSAQVFEAFLLLVSNPFVKKMVVSLTSDGAIWNAVVKNKAVQELRQAFCADAESAKPQNSGGRNYKDVGMMILKWLIESTKAKIAEFCNEIAKLVNEFFPSEEKRKNTSSFSNFDHVIRSSFMISILIFIVTIVMRFK